MSCRWRCREPARLASSPARPRPDVSPVLAAHGSPAAPDGRPRPGGLLGAGNEPAPLASDPLGAKNIGPRRADCRLAGRADDFSGRVPSAGDVAPQPVSLSPAEPAKKAAAAHDDAKKPADAKKDAKKKPERDSGAANDRRRATLEWRADPAGTGRIALEHG